jgi:hypothetical protein
MISFFLIFWDEKLCNFFQKVSKIIWIYTTKKSKKFPIICPKNDKFDWKITTKVHVTPTSNPFFSLVK